MLTVTYEIVTPQSAEHGDVAEHGFALPFGWRIPIDQICDEDKPLLLVSLRDARNMVGICEDSGSWFTEADGTDDYRTGANTRLSVHPPRSITPSSYARLRRIFCRTT